MKNILSIFALIMISLIAISPAFASNTQVADVTIVGGDGNTAIADNDYYNYENENEQNAGGIIIGSENVIQIVKNTNNQDSGNTNQVITDASTNVYFLPSQSSSSYNLDSGAVTSVPVHSVYMNKVMVVQNEKGKTMQKAGDVYTYSFKSALPLTAYVIPNKDINKAKYDIDCAPEYDWVNDKFTHGSLDVVYDLGERSTYTWFTFTVPEDGFYSLVLDSRVALSQDGKLNPYTTASSIDVAYTAEKTDHVIPEDYQHKVIGVVDMYDIFDNGMANTNS